MEACELFLSSSRMSMEEPQVTAGNRRLAERADHIWLGAIHLSTSIDIHHTSSSHLRSQRQLATSIRTSLLVPRRVSQTAMVMNCIFRWTQRFRHAKNGHTGAWLAWLKISYSHFEMVKCYISVKHSWFFLAHWYPNNSSQVEIVAVLVFAWAKLISYSQVLGFAGVVGAWRHLCWFLDPRKVLWWHPTWGQKYSWIRTCLKSLSIRSVWLRINRKQKI